MAARPQLRRTTMGTTETAERSVNFARLSSAGMVRPSKMTIAWPPLKDAAYLFPHYAVFRLPAEATGLPARANPRVLVEFGPTR